MQLQINEAIHVVRPRATRVGVAPTRLPKKVSEAKAAAAFKNAFRGNINKTVGM